MAVIREAKIKILSIIDNLGDGGLAVGDSERNETEYDGYIIMSDGEVAITYSEKTDGGDMSSEIRLMKDAVVVKRSGAIVSELRFEEGKPHRSLYSVPPYTFEAVVSTRKIRTEMNSQGGRVDLYYNMRIGGQEKSAVMKIWISTNSKQV